MRHSYDATMPIAAINGAIVAEVDVCIDYTAIDGEVEVKDITAYGWKGGKMIAAPLPYWLYTRVGAFAETLKDKLLAHAAEDYAADADEHGDWLHQQRKDAALEAHG
jgi:hypothetical protein